MPTGHLRLISKPWLDSFIAHVENGAERPGPILNFELVMMEPSALKRMSQTMQLDPKQWQRSFCDWQDMTLLDDIERNVDYYCVGLSSWNKLSTWFGAAPEIPIF